MTKFVYKMESILGIKLKIEEQAKTAYATAHSKLMKEEDILKILKQKVIMYQVELKKFNSVEAKTNRYSSESGSN